LPAGLQCEVYVVDNIPAAATFNLSDGCQAVLIAYHFIRFLMGTVHMLTGGLLPKDDGSGYYVNWTVDDQERKYFGRLLGAYLEIGVPGLDVNEPSDLEEQTLVAALEFVIAHEIVHGLEEDTLVINDHLTGFQDYGRARAQEFRADRRALALVLSRRGEHNWPELAFLGAEICLLAFSWLEQFSLLRSQSLVHPHSDTRLLRVHLEEPAFWRAAGIHLDMSDLTAAMLRRAFRLQAAIEERPEELWSPINHLLGQCTSDGMSNSDMFLSVVSLWFAIAPTDLVAHSLGAIWGSAIRMRDEDSRIGQTDVRLLAQLALFDLLYERLVDGRVRAISVAYEMARVRDRVAAETTLSSL